MNDNDKNNATTDTQNTNDVTDPNVHTENTLKPEQPMVLDENLLDIAERKKKEIAKKKRFFRQIMFVVRLLVLALVLLIAGVNFYKWQQKRASSPFSVMTPITAPPAANVIVDDSNPLTWKIYNNDNIKVFIRHPQNAILFEKTNPALKAEAVYAPKNEDPSTVDEKNLKDGYIFRVTPLDVGLRNIVDITNIKLQSFREKCPPTARFSDPRAELIDTIDARTFEITNCEVDYVVSYIPRFGIYYEVAQIFKGDFGVRQRYKGITAEMLRAFHFYPEDTRPVGPFRTYINEHHRIILAHPNLDEQCCVAPEPPKTDGFVTIERVVNLGDRTTYKDKDNFDGISVFITYAGVVTDYDGFVQRHRNFLIEDYKVVVGANPATEDIPIQLGKYNGTLLRGYTWRKNDLIYANIGNRVVILSVKNLTGERFDKTVQDILKSFETY